MTYLYACQTPYVNGMDCNHRDTSVTSVLKNATKTKSALHHDLNDSICVSPILEKSIALAEYTLITHIGATFLRTFW